MQKRPTTPEEGLPRDTGHDDFYVDVKPHTDGELAGKYDIYVHSRANDNLLLFSNQGYENRQDAVDLASMLFYRQTAVLYVMDADDNLDYMLDLR